MTLKQIIILLVALAGAIIMAIVGRSLLSAPDEVEVVEQPIIEQEPTLDVLVAIEDIPAGSSLEASRLDWKPWPESDVNDTFIVRDYQPDAITEYSPLIARSTFFSGDPIRNRKLIRSDSGYLSIILPAGKRAVSIRVDPERSTSGFILPRDRVDVIASYRTRSINSGTDVWITETILENILVLAIDAFVADEVFTKNQLAETITLELTAEEAEILVASKHLSDNQLTLVLRSIADSDRFATNDATHLITDSNEPEVKRPSTIHLIRYGVSENVRSQK